MYLLTQAAAITHKKGMGVWLASFCTELWECGKEYRKQSWVLFCTEKEENETINYVGLKGKKAADSFDCKIYKPIDAIIKGKAV